MEWLIHVFGSGRDLTMLQMSCRALVVFLAALAMLRVTGQRTFGHKTAVDQVVMIMLGAILSRGVTGSSPFLPVICASLVIVLFHRLLGWVCTYNDGIGNLIKGEDIVLYRNGTYLTKNMKRCMVTKKDLQESVRLELNEDDLSNVELLSMERCGSISVVKKALDK
jgi:uncharacterized membrane protein YcaP (DUF421 family)